MLINGWRIYFLKRLFGQQYKALREEVKHLKATLSQEAYVRHPKVKLFAAVTRAIEEIIPMNPMGSQFVLTGPLKRYKRVKRMGLPNRYRLFFRAFKVADQKSIFILWLGFPRKAGDKKDCYTVFQKMVKRGDLPTSIDDLIEESE